MVRSTLHNSYYIKGIQYNFFFFIFVFVTQLHTFVLIHFSVPKCTVNLIIVCVCFPDVIFAGLENKKEGDYVTLHTGVTDSQKHDLIRWTFGPTNPDSLVAEIQTKKHEITLNSDDIYRGKTTSRKSDRISYHQRRQNHRHWSLSTTDLQQ